MKKIICLVVVVLMIAAVAYAAKKVVIKPQDLAGLKGTWTGMLSFGQFEGGGTSPVTLEILNDAVPIKGRLTIENVPSPVANAFATSTGKHVGEAENGVISSQGTIVWTGQAGNVFEVTLTDAKKLEAWYFFRGMKGEATLTKKK